VLHRHTHSEIKDFFLSFFLQGPISVQGRKVAKVEYKTPRFIFLLDNAAQFCLFLSPMSNPKKRGGGRPKGRKVPYRNQVGFTAQQWALLNEIARADALDSPGAAIRKLIVEEARRRGIVGQFCESCGASTVEGHCVACEAAGDAPRPPLAAFRSR
jgi:hypothetical protein